MTHPCMMIEWVGASEHCKTYRVREMLYQYLLDHSNKLAYNGTISMPILQNDIAIFAQICWGVAAVVALYMIVGLICIKLGRSRSTGYLPVH